MRPYIGFVYPAGGQQGTTFQIKLGGQGLEYLNRAFVTGPGVTARVVQYDRVLGNQEVSLLSEQLKELKRGKPDAASTMMSAGAPMMASESTMMTSGTTKTAGATAGKDEATLKLIARIEKRTSEYVNRPSSAALASIAYVEVTIAPDALPGERELRLGTLRGLSNPLVFHVGQLPEICRKPMTTATLQVLGKEELALRKRPATEVEDRITLPCTVNGQIASGEHNRYRFTARKAQKLVITTQARSLIPYIADAVPGWFQPVLALYDGKGKEVAYDDDYRFKPDPTILYQVPSDGEYSLVIGDAIYRGREDFVYRISLGELPFVTSIFPLGGPVGSQAPSNIKGWNLGTKDLPPPASHAGPGTYFLAAHHKELVSNRVPFALDPLPECVAKEPNDTLKHAQPVNLPIIINGRMDHPNDWDVFKVRGQAGQTIIAEVYARRLDSPLDSVLKLTDAQGRLLAWNDDHEDPGSGVNTHHADSYLLAKLPVAGTYYIHLGDAARNGGEEYAYRLRLSEAQPDFALRVVPSSVSLRSKSTAQLSIYAIRKDGFTGPIKLALKDPPPGFSATPSSLSGTQEVARLTLKTTLVETPEPLNLTIAGSAVIGKQEISHDAVPAEDRMQAFLWRHLVPASELKVVVFDPNYQPAPARVPHARPPAEVGHTTDVVSTNSPANKPKFTKQQVAGLLQQLKRLYEENLLTDNFYDLKVTECEAAR